MSKLHRAFALIFLAFLQILQFFTNAPAQDVEAAIKIDARAGSIAAVSGKISGAGRRNLSFTLSAAGVDKLGERISDVRLSDEAGKDVAYRKFIAGEYVAVADFESWSYKIDLTPSRSQSSAAHISWLTANGGVLMLDDMLPQFAPKDKKVSARISMELPDGWRAYSANKPTDANVFESPNFEKAVIFIGKRLVNMSVATSGARLQLMFDGEWNFTRQEAAESAREIYDEYRKLFSGDAGEEIFVALLKFPNPTNPGVWQAETRGRNITIVSSDMPIKSQSGQRLHEQLRHEIFHLWLPNGVNLIGNYDWFYEGFALYQSLKTGVLLNRISFDDFLDTLTRAHNIDSSPIPRISLVELSKNRWSGANTMIYARGMLVAFLCDIAFLQKSRGKKEVADIFRDAFNKYRAPNASADGNTAVLDILQANAEIVPIVEKYIKGSHKIDWQNDLIAAGIDSTDENGRTSLKVIAKPTGRQKDLLDKLGYNNWRKLSRKSK